VETWGGRAHGTVLAVFGIAKTLLTFESEKQVIWEGSIL